MNRRSFIAKALAGLAVIPLLRARSESRLLQPGENEWAHYVIQKYGEDQAVYINGQLADPEEWTFGDEDFTIQTWARGPKANPQSIFDLYHLTYRQ